MSKARIWQAKLDARLHDPIEKALILMRTKEGHEGGTSAVLRKELGLDNLPSGLQEAVKISDHWASAADRAAFPNRDADGRYPSWQQVRFAERPVIVHPLTGGEFDLGKLVEIEPDQAKALALDHLRGLIHENEEGQPDLEKTALAFWRFGPEIDAEEIQSLWAQLPADTRVPDHTIHDHLDLTAAFATAFAADAGGPALLAVSLGPVQEFIAAARSTSDLWAGSHLLSRIAWEAMRVICQRLGPEAILFPRLRGVPQVDLWLRHERGLREDLFRSCEWTRSASDANPLFAAALPNRFTAIVPAAHARDLAEEITTAVRRWVHDRTYAAFRKVLGAAGMEDRDDLHGYRQIEEQLSGFPEVHWAVVPWSLVATDNEGRVEASDPRLAEVMQPFFESSPPGYLGSKAWQLISGGVKLEEGWFWRPNPGSLYPALHELLERGLAAVKGMRPFEQVGQRGWRDSLTGEAEWLTTDPSQLDLPPGQRSDTLWARVAAKRPAWAREGEHLGALGTLKRLWPTLFVEELGGILDKDFNRFVVSTHAMALAGSLAVAIQGERELPGRLRKELEESRPQRVALPRKLDKVLRDHPDEALLRKLPGWLEEARESEDDAGRRRADRLLREWLGHEPESYYALLLMDGDRMGAWLSAAPELTLPHEASYHPQIREALKQQHGFDHHFIEYAGENRSPSPSRHMAISEALNHFALSLAPDMAESRHHGRVIYAGGDDLMAMLPVIDLLPAMAGLRAAYSGIDPATAGGEGIDAGFHRQANGFVMYRERLLRLMGDKATASCGAVVAHHQAPLGAVLRELRAAERRAKEQGDRDAFSITVVKRSGGALRLTAKWGEPLRLLARLRAFLAEPGVSRRAVYNSAVWLRDLPAPEGDGGMAARLLAYQMARQISGNKKPIIDHYKPPELAQGIVRLAIEAVPDKERIKWIENFLSVAEFLARQTRSPGARPAAAKEDAA